jgi:hypothetical protein
VSLSAEHRLVDWRLPTVSSGAILRRATCTNGFAFFGQASATHGQVAPQISCVAGGRAPLRLWVRDKSALTVLCDYTGGGEVKTVVAFSTLSESRLRRAPEVVLAHFVGLTPPLGARLFIEARWRRIVNTIILQLQGFLSGLWCFISNDQADRFNSAILTSRCVAHGCRDYDCIPFAMLF